MLCFCFGTTLNVLGFFSVLLSSLRQKHTSRHAFLPHRWLKSPVWGLFDLFFKWGNNLHRMPELCFHPTLLQHSWGHSTAFSPVTGITCWQVKFLQTTDAFIFLHYTFRFTLHVHDLTAILELAFAGVEAAKWRPFQAALQHSEVWNHRDVFDAGGGGALLFSDISMWRRKIFVRRLQDN